MRFIVILLIFVPLMAVSEDADLNYVNSLAERAGWGVEPNSRHVLRAIGRKARNDWDSKMQNLVVAKHIKGTFGKSYTSAEELKRRSKPIEFSREGTKQVIKQMDQQIQKQLDSYDKVVELPECKKSQTIRREVSKSREKDSNQPQMDLLFIDDGEIPIEYQEVFGKKIRIVPYNGRSGGSGQIMAKSMGVWCLPTRFRLTERYYFVDYGENALKNYDDNYHASGKLHQLYQ